MIPSFGLGDVLPPFIGSPVGGAGAATSPYIASMSELVDSFGTSVERARILRGLKAYRDELKTVGFARGFQWIDGSFVEACEVVKGRPPGDVDVVNLLFRPLTAKNDPAWNAFIVAHGSTLLDSAYCKATFYCDAYPIDLDVDADIVAGQAAYWFGLFSHQRSTNRWKGMVQIDLFSDDDAAMRLLATKGPGW